LSAFQLSLASVGTVYAGTVIASAVALTVADCFYSGSDNPGAAILTMLALMVGLAFLVLGSMIFTIIGWWICNLIVPQAAIFVVPLLAAFVHHSSVLQASNMLATGVHRNTSSWIVACCALLVCGFVAFRAATNFSPR
jgi:hypothetical protein